MDFIARVPHVRLDVDDARRGGLLLGKKALHGLLAAWQRRLVVMTVGRGPRARIPRGLEAHEVRAVLAHPWVSQVHLGARQGLVDVAAGELEDLRRGPAVLATLEAVGLPER